MEGERLVTDPGLGQRRHQPRSEVKRRGRGGDRPLLPGEHGLVILDIALVGAAAAGDIGRKRHPPGAGEQGLDRLVAVEVEQRRSVRRLFKSNRSDAQAEIHMVALAHPPRIAKEGAPAPRALALVKGGADPRPASRSFELGRDDPGVVENEHVSTAQQARQ